MFNIENLKPFLIDKKMKKMIYKNKKNFFVGKPPIFSFVLTHQIGYNIYIFNNIRFINTKRKLDDYQEYDDSDSNKKRRIEYNGSDDNNSSRDKSEQDQNMSENQQNLYVAEHNKSEDSSEENINESEQDQNMFENQSESDESEQENINSSSDQRSEVSDNNNIRRPMGYLYSGSEESLPENIPLSSAVHTAEQALEMLSESRRNPDTPAEVINSLESDVVKAVEHINKDPNVDENQVL